MNDYYELQMGTAIRKKSLLSCVFNPSASAFKKSALEQLRK